MRALQLFGDRDLRLVEMDAPPPPGPGEVQIEVTHVALNHIDVWGFRGMAFAKRQLPLVVGAEGSGRIAATGEGVTGFAPGDAVTMYGALTCGECRRCKAGIDNLCEKVGGVYGFHIDGFARERLNMPARLVVKVPDGVSQEAAACAGIAFGTTQHMCSTMRSWSRARRCLCTPEDPALARWRSGWRRRWAAPSSPPSAMTRRA